MPRDVRSPGARIAALRGSRTRVFAGLASVLAVLVANELRTTSRSCLAAKWNTAAVGPFALPQECSVHGAGQGVLLLAGHGAGAWHPRWSLHPLERITLVALVVATVSAFAQITLDAPIGNKARRLPARLPLEGAARREPESSCAAGASRRASLERPPRSLEPSPKAVQLAPRAAAPNLISRHLAEVLGATGAVAPRVPADAVLAASLRNGHLLASFERVEILAAGGFGLVCRARHRLEGVWYAIKLVPIRGLGAHEDLSTRPELREVRSLKALADSRHVVRYHTAWCEEPCCLAGALASAAGEACECFGSGPKPISGSTLQNAFSRVASQASTRRAGSLASLADCASTVQSSLGFVWDGAGAGEAAGAEASCDEAERGEVALPEAARPLPAGEAKLASATEKAHTVVLLMQMELCDGTTLRKWLDSDSRGREPLSFAWGANADELPLELQFAEHLTKACREIHRAGLVHRDLKPANILVVGDKVLKVGDFGLARPVAEPQGRSEEGVVGTPAYCAPEGGARATAASDIFSLALVILELLCPPMRTKMESAKVFEAFRERRELPRHIEESLPGHAELLRRMGSPRPEDRPSAGEAYAALKQLRPVGLALQSRRRQQ